MCFQPKNQNPLIHSINPHSINQFPAAFPPKNRGIITPSVNPPPAVPCWGCAAECPRVVGGLLHASASALDELSLCSGGGGKRGWWGVRGGWWWNHTLKPKTTMGSWKSFRPLTKIVPWMLFFLYKSLPKIMAELPKSTIYFDRFRTPQGPGSWWAIFQPKIFRLLGH